MKDNRNKRLPNLEIKVYFVYNLTQYPIFPIENYLLQVPLKKSLFPSPSCLNIHSIVLNDSFSSGNQSELKTQKT